MLFLTLSFYCTSRENLEEQSSKYWHCQIQCCSVWDSDPFLPHEKISVFPLHLVKIHGFLLALFFQMTPVRVCWDQHNIVWRWGGCFAHRLWAKYGWVVRQRMIQWVDDPAEKPRVRDKVCLELKEIISVHWSHSLCWNYLWAQCHEDCASHCL